MPGTRTRTWSVPTSPRNPYKLADEIRLLRDHGFVGARWDAPAQVSFSQLLHEADFYHGEVHAADPAFAARDRINRAPRTFGFVRLRRGGPLEITPAGYALLADEGIHDLFLHQLLKWQYPSPNHNKTVYRELFRIRPFLEMLRLVRDLDGISKGELALFGVPLIDYRNYDAARQGIVAFRQEYAAISGARRRKEYVAQKATELLAAHYADDIAEGRVGSREARGEPATAKSMLRRKLDNARDYADAAVRYFRATGLFTVTARASRLHLLQERQDEADAILSTFQREPVRFTDDEDFYAWSGDPTQPALPSDDRQTLESQIRALFETLPATVQRGFAPDLGRRLAAHAPIELKRDYIDLVSRAAEEAVRQQRIALAGQDIVDEIVDMFQRIRNADAEIIDRPLFFEWNSWRALAMLDDGEIRHNFTVDQTGQPLSPAPGRGGDIECTYDGCHLVVEVTLTAGQTQYMKEGEPVNRHVGLMQAQVVDAGDHRPVYGLFLAPTLNPTVLAHFWQLHLLPRPTAEFRGHVKIIPLALDDFIAMLEVARPRQPVRAADVARFCAAASDVAHRSTDERTWYAAIRDLARSWLDADVAA
jgi:hypothetical protein